MKKRFLFPKIVIGVSVAWLVFFGFNFIYFLNSNREISRINTMMKEVDNLVFYERVLKTLRQEYEGTEKESFSAKSTSEFIAKIPKIGELSGISEMKVDNAGIRREGDIEITELKISAESSFPNIANFIDVFERSRLAVQIYNISIKYESTRLQTQVVLRIYKRLGGE